MIIVIALLKGTKWKILQFKIVKREKFAAFVTLTKIMATIILGM